MKTRGSTGILAFSLVELLTVMAIISLLSGLVLSAVLRTRGKARAAVCLNHHKQLQLAWQLHAADRQDRLVPNADSDRLQQSPSWVFGVLYISEVAIHRMRWRIRRFRCSPPTWRILSCINARVTTPFRFGVSQ